MSASNGGSRLLLLRHGESTWNVSGLWAGWGDPQLSDSGEREARILAGKLRPFGFTKVCSSDLARARVTANILAVGLGIDPPIIDSRLRERDVGQWAGLSSAEIELRWPGRLDAWGACDDEPPAGGGEHSESVVARMQSCLEEVWSTHGHQNMVVVSHAGAIRALDRALGSDGAPIANLGGRWLHWDGTTPMCGEPFDPTAGEPAATGPP
jgi:broad specificity phosphatase PhoE